MSKVSNFFKTEKKREKHAKQHEEKQEIVIDNGLLLKLSTLKNDLEQQVNEQSEPKNKNCCLSLFSCMKSASTMIPEEYISIARWLTELAIKEAQTEVNEEVLVSALSVSLSYVAKEVLGNSIPAKVLIELIEGIAKDFDLTLDSSANYESLLKYCEEHAIIIPDVIMTFIRDAAVIDDTTQLAMVG